MSTVSPLFPMLWKFVAASAAAMTFVLGIFVSLQLIVSAIVGDPSFSAATNFWYSFGSSSFAKLILGLTLATLAFTEFTDRLIVWLRLQPEQSWLRHATSYFVGFFAIIALSTASFFLAQFPSVPWTHLVAFFVVTACSLLSAVVYGAVASRRI